jgi:3-oxoadipate enol-lactonase
MAPIKEHHITDQQLCVQDHYIQTSLGRLRVRTAGQGSALMFWSSLLMDSEMWLAQAAYFIGRYLIILVDPPGHGASERLTRSFTFEECAQCITQILDTLQIDQTHFVGNSWGGMIGGTFAALYPDRVGISVLMNATATRASLYQKVEFESLIRIARFAGKIPELLTNRVIKAFIGTSTAKQRPHVAKEIRMALRRVDIHSVYWAIKSVVPARPDQRLRFQTIRTPVLVIAGAEDRTFPVAETQVMAASTPNSEFIVMPETGHLAGLEMPDRVNTIIDDFLQRHQESVLFDQSPYKEST